MTDLNPQVAVIAGTKLPTALAIREKIITSYPFEDPSFKEANALLTKGRKLVTDGQTESGIQEIREGLKLLTEIEGKDYTKLIKILPFKKERFDESLELAEATQESAHKLIEKYEHYIKEIQAGKITTIQPLSTASTKNIHYIQASILSNVFGSEGLVHEQCAEDREKAFQILGITSAEEKSHIIKLATELPEIQNRYKEDFSPDDGVLLRKYGINNPNAKYNDKSISEATEELKLKLIQPVVVILPPSPIFVITSPPNNDPRIPAYITSNPIPATILTPPPPTTNPPKDIVSLFLAEAKSFKPNATPLKGSEIIKLIEMDAPENHGLKFIQALAKEGIISSDEERTALLQVADETSIAKEVSKSNFDDTKFPSVFGVTFTGGYSSVRGANRLYQFITQYLNPEGERNFLSWSINNYSQTSHNTIPEVQAFNGSVRKAKPDDAHARTEAEKDLEFISKLLDHASTNGILGANTIQLLDAILSDPASVNANASTKAFNKELSKLAKLIDKRYGSLINKVKNHVLDPNEQKGGKFSAPGKETLNLALALTVPPDNIQRFLFKRGMISTLNILPLEASKQVTKNPPLLTPKKDPILPIQQKLKTFSIKNQSELEKIFINVDSKERLLIKAYFQILNEEGLLSINIIKKRFPAWSDFDNVLGSINNTLNKNGLQNLVFFPNSEDPASKAYSVLVQKGVPAGDTISSFEKFCEGTGATADRRKFAEDIILSDNTELIAALNPDFAELIKLANSYHTETDPGRQSTAESLPPPTPVTAPEPAPQVIETTTPISILTSIKSGFITELVGRLGMKLETGLPTRKELRTQFGTIIKSITDTDERKSLTTAMLQLGKGFPVTFHFSDGKKEEEPVALETYDEKVLELRNHETQ